MHHSNFLKICTPVVYGITSEFLVEDDNILLKKVEESFKYGVKLLQYRNKQPDHVATPYRQAQKLRELCCDYNVPLIVNDDLKLAKESGAHGIHLGRSDSEILKARHELGSKAIIGATCNGSVDYGLKVQKQGASYAAFGRFFNSKSKPSALKCPIETLIEAKKKMWYSDCSHRWYNCWQLQKSS